ncbi:p12 [Ectropis obliqua nucleopolyhedrovirus]|uniref:p12 n=1 Tax=Ectropis obliqua nucleopolyhedrovirus TaxID=59376 RepID=A0EYY4_9ABAC|nr:p12 [Ectropis obliqua nucleopolyhedrovirus]ABI35763.1 p12 [Ectropis obliqua nucleopolyhedrovirus]QWV59650.1 p12 [Ectropis obliqua nucleopolyhedrovirus]UYO72879.1 p12 [Ectropis obliqua nucleopolyhedrovirus]
MSDGLIDSLNNELLSYISSPASSSMLSAPPTKVGNGKQRSSKTKTVRDTRFDPVDDVDNSAIDPVTLINSLNSNNKNMASFIIADESLKKQNTFKILSKVSSSAKGVLKDIEDDKESMPLTTLRATNVLRLLSNIYDNQF